MIDIRATTIFVINRNSRCPFFLFSKKIILLSAFIYECVDQPRKWMFQGDWGCATTSFLHRIRIHALLANLWKVEKCHKWRKESVKNEGYSSVLEIKIFFN